MSDEEDKKSEKDKDDKGKKKKPDAVDDTREGDLTEPTPKNIGLFEWLESLFDGSADSPEKVDCCVVTGTKFEKLGPMIKQCMFEPKNKPSREALVRWTNSVVNAMQIDCDVQRKSVVYGFHAWHFTRDSEPYMRHIVRMQPKGNYSKQGEPREDDEEMSTQDKVALQVMGHGERMFGLYGGGFEGLLDRMDRILERQDNRIEKQDARIEKLTDMLERALSLEAERVQQREWAALKTRSVEKVLDTGMSLVPPIVNKLLGQQVLATKETAETITIKQFLQKLPEDKYLAVMGNHDATKGPVQDGILTPEQADILGFVAFGKLDPDTLDDLMPGGKHGITNEQLQKIVEAGLTLQDLAPLHMVFENRQNRRRS